MLNCKQATRLMSQAQDQKLPLKVQMGLRLHLLICSGCTNFNKQLHFIRTACRRVGGE